MVDLLAPASHTSQTTRQSLTSQVTLAAPASLPRRNEAELRETHTDRIRQRLRAERSGPREEVRVESEHWQNVIRPRLARWSADLAENKRVLLVI